MKRFAIVVLCSLVVLSPVFGQSGEQKKATVAYLQGLQAQDGGFLPAVGGSEPKKSSLRATSAALRALKYFGGDVPNRKGAIAFVESCFDAASGGFADSPGGKPDVAVTAVGLMAAVELKGVKADSTIHYLAEHAKSFEERRIAAAGFEAAGRWQPRVEEWLKDKAFQQRDDGGFGDGSARDSGSAAVVILRLHGKLEQRDKLLAVLRGGQQKDGGFAKTGAKESDMETTYRVMRCFMMLKEKPKDVDGLRGFVETCRNKDGGYGTAVGQPSTVSGTYFAGIVRHWLDDK